MQFEDEKKEVEEKNKVVINDLLNKVHYMNLNTIYGELSDKDFKRISVYIYDHYGINLYPNKKVLLKSRLQNCRFR